MAISLATTTQSAASSPIMTSTIKSLHGTVLNDKKHKTNLGVQAYRTNVTAAIKFSQHEMVTNGTLRV